MSLWNYAEQCDRSWARFDMRGHGNSDGIFREFTISRALDDCRGIIRLLWNRPIILVGSSMGGWLAAQLATDHLQYVVGAVLIAPAFSFVDQLHASLSVAQQSEFRNKGWWHFEGAGDNPGFDLGYAALEDAKQYDLLTNPPQYDCPIRILHGKLDDVVPYQQSIKFAENLPGGTDIKVDILPEADHRLTGHIDHIKNSVDELWQMWENKQDSEQEEALTP